MKFYMFLRVSVRQTGILYVFMSLSDKVDYVGFCESAWSFCESECETKLNFVCSCESEWNVVYFCESECETKRNFKKEFSYVFLSLSVR